MPKYNIYVKRRYAEKLQKLMEKKGIQNPGKLLRVLIEEVLEERDPRHSRKKRKKTGREGRTIWL